MGILWFYSFIAVVRGKSSSTSIVYVQKLSYINSAWKCMNRFAIVYMVNPKLYVNKLLREQVYKCLKEIFHPINMSGIINVMKK